MKETAISNPIIAKNIGKAKTTVKPAVCQLILNNWLPKADKIANRQ